MIAEFFGDVPNLSEVGSVLLVDDDESLLHILTICLRRAGYRVLPSLSPDEALQDWSRERDRVSLLITDLDLRAEIDGAELARLLAEEKPTLQVIYMSGGDFSRLGVEGPSANCIPKPFSLHAFIPLVKRFLAGREPIAPHPPVEAGFALAGTSEDPR
jgi:two-component system, cell cycle sensor histidine kinase and response regulator CckA